MAIAYIQECVNQVAGTGNPLTAAVVFASPVITGHALFVVISQAVNSNRTYVVSDNIVGTTGWVMAKSYHPSGIGTYNQIWYRSNHPGGTVTISVTHNSATTAFTAAAIEFEIGIVVAESNSNFTTTNSTIHRCGFGMASGNDVLSLCCAHVTVAATTLVKGTNYTRLPAAGTGVTHLFQWQIFPSGTTSEGGTFTNTGGNRNSNGAMVFFASGGPAPFLGGLSGTITVPPRVTATLTSTNPIAELSPVLPPVASIEF